MTGNSSSHVEVAALDYSSCLVDWLLSRLDWLMEDGMTENWNEHQHQYSRWEDVLEEDSLAETGYDRPDRSNRKID